MRNVKLLWLIIVVLIIGLLVQLAALINMRIEIAKQPADPQPVEMEHPGGPDADHDPAGKPHDEKLDRVLAAVGKEQITEQEIREQTFKKYGKELLNQAVDHLVVQMEGKALGIHVSEADIKQEITRMQAGYDSEEDFYRIMADLGMDKESLQEDAYYKLMSERIAMKGIVISDEMVDQYMMNHPEEFQSFTKLRIHLIVTSTRAQADSVISELHNGVSFERIARERSIDDLTRPDGGDLGWIEEDDPFVDPRIMNMARRMQANEISPVIALDSTYAVIRLTARRDIDKEMTEQIRDDVRKQLALQEAPSLQQILRQLRVKYQVTIAD